MSSLHSACAHGSTQVVKELLQFKSKIDIPTNRGHYPIHLAVFSGNFINIILVCSHCQFALI